ncbi:hypothetical protein GJAV_G00218160 [Gymnothorax javanicus]|nr:hypothetical protein GJAV_G00218160 [Gymnothorax javanicus]
MDLFCSHSGLDPLWDWNRTWHTSNPDLTQCFQNTVLVWIPCIYLWLVVPLYCLHLRNSNRGYICISRMCWAKTVLGFLLAFYGFVEFFYLLLERYQEIQHHLVFLVSPVMRSLTMVLAVCVIHLERMRGCRSSLFLFIFWLLATVCSLVPMRSKVLLAIKEGFSEDAVRYLSFFLYVLLLAVQLVLCCFADPPPNTTNPVLGKNPCPVSDASFLSKIFFWWFGRLVVKGYRSTLQSHDLWTLREEDSSDNILSGLEQDWNLQRAKMQQSDRPVDGAIGVSLRPCLMEQALLFKKLQKEQSCGFRLLHVLTRRFGPYFLSGVFYLILHDVFMFTIPQVLSLLLGFMREDDAPLWKGYFFATLLFVLSSLQSLCNHQYLYTCFSVGMRVKTAVMGLVYRKSLVLSNAARRTCTVGEVVNLVVAGTHRDHTLSLLPVAAFRSIGLGGIATVIIIFPLNGFIAKKRSKLQEVQMQYTDGRIKLMNEILGGIKILKFYAWEKAFKNRVLEQRERELRALKRSQILYSISIASFNSSSFLIAFAMFGVYVLIDSRNVLDAQKVFVSMALINILKAPLSQLPFAMSTTMQAIVSLKRLGKFLSQDELKADRVEKASCTTEGDSLTIENGTFSWSKEGPPCLRRVSMRVPHGALVAVVGHVGSGKSSLLSAFLGEMEKWSGHVAVRGSVAYVPQQAWIQNASLGENIVFGRERKDSWYWKVVEACALLPDLEILPAGDATEIGEKGVNLSGGQKQRVSLARAVYCDRAVYLLDDPLSAVDAHVGQHIFDKVIGPNGLLRDKTRILVTHGLSYLPQADLILVMVNGEITEMGSYAELLGRHGAFAEFMRVFACSESKESSVNKDSDVQNYTVGSRKSTSQLSMIDLIPSTRDLSHVQLISGDTCGASLQNTDTEVGQELEQGETGRLTEADCAHTGRVKLEMYREYFCTIGLKLILPIVFLYAFQQAASLSYNYWLSLWADAPVLNGTQAHATVKLGVFGALGFAQGVAIFGTTVAISVGGIMASRHLHLDLLNNVLRSPMAFFERCPSGNLLNRFAKEVDAIDCMIPDGLKMMLNHLFKLLEVCIIVLMATPFATAVILPLAVFYTFVQNFYVTTSCQLRRLESVSRSPIYTHFNETVQGACVIRAYGEQHRFIHEADRRVDINQTAYFPRFVATRWLAVNLELLGNILVLAASVLSVMGKASLSPGLVGLAVSHSLQVTAILSWIVRSWTDVENNIVSVERVKEYADTPKEAEWTIEGINLPESWPHTGTIEFHDYGLQYRKGLDWALKGISLHIQEREKVGIVGRTGAGKSSLALGIFRILEAAKGEIYIDGVNIAKIGLHDLRSRITIIPQDPVLFSGSLRMNLDPFDSYSDQEVWKALELAHLKSFVSGLPDKLNHECAEGGENLSLGQRQLVCLARALLRKTKVLVLDEATAAVDLETDNLIQSTIRSQFEDCTVLTIAHRLNTIMDYTRVIVMERGHIVESDSPSQLIAQRGRFYHMCRDAGLA